MKLKSNPERYGTVAVSIHWLSAILILALLGSGFRAVNSMDAAAKAGFLRFHIPVAIIVLILTAFRIVWWWRFDQKPLPVEGAPRWQERIARWVHVAFYVAILAMVASGIGMIFLSGAAPAVFGAPGAVLPNFTDYPPRAPHGLGAFLLVGLLVVHAGAALYHQFIRRDGLLRRMWYGGRLDRLETS
ncbi:MAG: cytochrome b/b6 domain-containing protein [Phyllobacterium sp.]|uniref:cytochrome b n=1 Tax=Phyllobacterium sp. TaxID=1871046 RepID=UPI0030F2E049